MMTEKLSDATADQLAALPLPVVLMSLTSARRLAADHEDAGRDAAADVAWAAVACMEEEADRRGMSSVERDSAAASLADWTDAHPAR